MSKRPSHISRHGQAARQSWRELAARPFGSLMTVGVLGLSLALPVLFYLLLKAGLAVTGAWQQSGELSVFLRLGLEQQQQQLVYQQVDSWPESDEVSLVTPDDAVVDFAAMSGMGDALALLDHNPLPPLLRVLPQAMSPAASERLQQRLAALPDVEQVRLDSDWLRRLHALLGMLKTSVTALSLMLGTTVLLIIGNTIRLLIQQRRDDIEITFLLGASRGFVWRPFLYTGFWLGMLAGLLAWWVVAVLLLWLDSALLPLMALYGSELTLPQLSASESGVLLGLSSLLGILGAALALMVQPVSRE